MVDVVAQVIQAPRPDVDAYVSRSGDWTDTLEFLDPDTGLAQNLTGYSIEIWIRQTFGSDILIAYLSTLGGEIVVSDAPGGIAHINMSVLAVRSMMPAGKWVWYGVLSDADEEAEFVRGRCYVLAGFHDGLPTLIAPSLDFSVAENSQYFGMVF